MLAFGIQILLIGLGWLGTDMVLLTFGVLALAYGASALSGTFMYGAATVPKYLTVGSLSGVFAGLS